MKRRLRVLISAGPTRERIDPVRFISNYSTGYMGGQLASEALARGHRVTVVRGPTTEAFPRSARVIPVEDARSMERAMRGAARRADAIIMAAAVADFRAGKRSGRKLSRQGRLTLRLEATPDIIGRLPRRHGQIVAGFALETSDVLARARRKLGRKRLDAIVAQRATRPGGPFGRRAVQAWLLTRRGTTPLGVCSKRRIARALLDKVEGLWYGQLTPQHPSTS